MRVPSAFYKELKDHQQSLLDKQIICESSSQFASPIVHVRKNDHCRLYGTDNRAPIFFKMHFHFQEWFSALMSYVD